MSKMYLNGITYGGYDYHEYSTEEHVVGKWIDGKVLYEKTVACTANGETSHNIQNIDLIVDLEARVVNLSTGVCIKIPAYNTDSYYGYVVGSRTNINVYIVGETWTPSATQPCYVTLKYTKTT